LARETLCIGLLLLHGSALAGLQEARNAYEQGDYRTALANFRPLAEKGDLEAQTMVGWMLVQGLGVSPNLQEGRKWLERAASMDGNAASAKAQHNIGVMYENGIGVPRDLQKAASWYLRGAQNGDASAQSNLGTLYLDGLGVVRDPQKGVYWLTKAAQQGDPEAYSNLGRVYFEGIGVPKNWPLSYYFLFMAVNHSGREVPNARSNLEIVTRKLSATQLAEGKRLVEEALKKR
jgi:TPR repeat protein